jgi:surfeit locus 1 family protein
MNPIPSPPEKADKRLAASLVQMPGVLFGRRWWWATLVVIAGMIFLARLGFWQLDRLEQRRAANAVFESQFYGELLDLNAELPSEAATDLVDRRGFVRGRFDYSEQIILKVQNLGSVAGVHLVTPLMIEGKDQVILVDRGWIPEYEAAQGDLERFNEPAEEPADVLITGTLQSSQILPGGRTVEISEPQEEWYRIDVEAIQTQMPYDLLPVYLLQDADEEASETLPIRQTVEPDLSEGSHLGYAIQWFLFALILGIGYVSYVSIHNKQVNARCPSSFLCL